MSKGSKQKTTTENYRNRIVGHAEVDPRELSPHPLNWRTHDDRQRYVLKGTMHEVGWVKDVIVNKHTGNIIDGHLRVSLAMEKGEASVPVTYIDISEDEEAMILATLDPIVELAGTDQFKLDALLESVRTDDLAIRALLDEISGATDEMTAEALEEEEEDVMTEAAREAIVQYNIIFDSEEHQRIWYGFLRYLRRLYPDSKTVSQRIAAYCSELDLGDDGTDDANG